MKDRTSSSVWWRSLGFLAFVVAVGLQLNPFIYGPRPESLPQEYYGAYDATRTVLMLLAPLSMVLGIISLRRREVGAARYMAWIAVVLGAIGTIGLAMAYVFVWGIGGDPF